MRKPHASKWFVFALVLVFCGVAQLASAQVFTSLLTLNGANGSAPDYGPLIQPTNGNFPATDGNFYGTTSGGGANGSGTVFKLTPAGAQSILYSFCSQPSCADGETPYAGVIQASDGNFYGTTYAGGKTTSNCASGCGTVFQLTPQGALTTLYTFCSQTNCVDGVGPSAGLIQASDGNLYGTTYAGGGGNCGGGCGTIYRISLQGSFSTLKTFTNAQGAQLFAGLIQASDGNLYGTTEGGGANSGHGTVFSITLGGSWTLLYSFCAQTNCTDGARPYAPLIQGSDGNLYGTTAYGGSTLSSCASSCGTVFKITTGGALTTLYSFCTQANCADGMHPYGGLIQTSDGNFYGTTAAGGANGDGSVFKITPSGSLFTLHSFDNTDGQTPYSALLQASNGNFYGTTSSGGSNSDGTVFGLYQTSVTTWHNDNLRTGQTLYETTLTPTSVGTENFGQLCSQALDAQVYGQPLVLANATFQGNQYSSLIYVVTENNTLYVLNGTPPALCKIVGSLSLTPPNQYPADCHYVGTGSCNTVAPIVGALGTPVIQTGNPNSIGTLYVVTETQDVSVGQQPANWYHYLHQVSLDTVTESVAPVRIYPPALSSTCLSCAQPSFWSRNHIQRPGLLLVGNYVYIAFSMMDGLLPLPNGAAFGYNVTNLSAPPLYFATTIHTYGGGGIWQDGAGLAYGPDETGTNYIYFNTGNGNWDGNANWGDSFVKLYPNSLTVPSPSQNQNYPAYFTPSDQYYRNCQDPYEDLDFGSGGVMLTPPNSNWPSLAFSEDKEGGIWAMDRLNPGGFNLGQCSDGNGSETNCSACSMSQQDNQNVQTVWQLNNHKMLYQLHNTPAYWNNNLYVGTPQGPVYDYAICDDLGSGLPICNTDPLQSIGPDGQITTQYGTTPMVSAYPGYNDAVVWFTGGGGLADGVIQGFLYAFDANSMEMIYVNAGNNSPCGAVDQIAPVSKFSLPTVANGYVYVAAQQCTWQGSTCESNNGTGTFYIFGLNRQCNASPKRPGHSQSVASKDRAQLR